ncbi:MAG: PIG-L family deacetylase [Gemmatimonadaceae bacterium]|nr:PIG-L family deacetylase [Gemmatimonadaceae bacterium]
MSTVLVVVAHPDDEVLGCGGTIARYARDGHAVHVLVLADGVGARYAAGVTDSARTEERGRRTDALQRAAAILGVSGVETADFPDNAMDTVPLLHVAQRIEQSIARLTPHIVLTHHAGDVNQDHRQTHDAVVAACRPQPGHSVRTLLTFEVASSTEWQLPGTRAAFEPNWFVDTTDTLELQLAALEAYAEELREWPHPRSVRALRARAEWRGATVGCAAAEAFMVGRHIVGRPIVRA